jgi:hypothetical protein
MLLHVATRLPGFPRLVAFFAMDLPMIAER